MIQMKEMIKIFGWSVTGLLITLFISSPNVFHYWINM